MIACSALSIHDLQAQSPYRFDKMTDGVYVAVPAVSGPDRANVPVIVTDRDVVLVGTHLFPGDARALLEHVRTITDKPVRFIVNTHYHASTKAARESYPADRGTSAPMGATVIHALKIVGLEIGGLIVD